MRPEVPDGLGMVLEEGRGSLPYSLVHGEALVRCAALALAESGIQPIDPDTAWPTLLELLDSAEVLVLHDALCPMTPPDFLARCATLAAAGRGAVVGFRPVTDTVKRVRDGVVGDTVDRSGLLQLASPVVLPASLVRGLGRPWGHDLRVLVSRLAQEQVPLEWVEAPAEGRAVRSRDEVRLLEALTAR